MKFTHIAIAVLLPTFAIPALADSNKNPQSTQDSSAATERTWNWSKIDTNKDHLIEPSQMEAWLAAHPGVQKGG